MKVVYSLELQYHLQIVVKSRFIKRKLNLYQIYMHRNTYAIEFCTLSGILTDMFSILQLWFCALENQIHCRGKRLRGANVELKR